MKDVRSVAGEQIAAHEATQSGADDRGNVPPLGRIDGQSVSEDCERAGVFQAGRVVPQPCAAEWVYFPRDIRDVVQDVPGEQAIAVSGCVAGFDTLA
jgi:hypothetical protein